MLQACQNGDLAKAKELRSQGAKVNVANKDGWQPMHFACFFGHLFVAEWLRLQGAAVDVKDKLGIQPMHLACENGHRGCAEWLLSQAPPSTWRLTMARSQCILLPFTGTTSALIGSDRRVLQQST